MTKAADAFRTISEVADELEIHKHVLRFWENRFPQIRPMKRGGGRRYYRPEDLDLLRGIRHLLHSDGYTIKGVQKILREQGVDEVKRCWRKAGTPVETKPAAAGRKAAALARADGRGRAASSGERDVRRAIAAAVRELEVCRRLLGEAHGRGARSVRATGRARQRG